ncbi:MAG: helicase-exonuclease AddAB subunit AddA [Sedimentisphaerales bacterium]|nr:helicase-exonuclease AddAB subunit AddA [Sedimentisphaerales bacterium]
MTTTVKTPNWTPAQKDAIASRSNTLVSAAAGTGKTAVLAQRAVQIIADPQKPTEVSQLLVLTFTKAAAEEMRSRISQQLRQQYLATSQPFLRQQLLQIDAANISTIHVFCKKIITEYFHLISLDPTFSILDEDQQKLIKSEILPEILEHAWSDPQLAPALQELLDLRNANIDTSPIIQDIARLHGFLENVPSRSQWISHALDAADDLNPLDSQLAQQQIKDIINILQQCRQRLQFTQWQETQHYRRVEGPNAQGPWTTQIQNDILPVIDDCIQALKNNNIPTAAQILRDFTFPRRKNRPKWMSEDLAKIIKAPSEQAKDDLKDLLNLALLNADYNSLIAPPFRRQSKIILQLLQLFDQRYRQIKKDLNALDYADLEHYALQLLTAAPETPESPNVASILRSRFRYVFVDEYQDINPVQDAIISQITRSDNLFTVGDIKQSIYGFRGSDPTIFAHNLQNASRETINSDQTRLIDLNINFRSNPNILNFVNAVFSRIMSPAAADISYDQNASLYPPADAEQPTDQPAVELHILDDTPPDDADQPDDENNSDEDESNSDLPDNLTEDGTPTTTAAQRQAAVIVQRIQQILGNAPHSSPLQITDRETGKTRPAEYRDIAILMRSLSHRAKEFTEVIRLSGIPVDSQANAGYFEATEITDCLCLLKVLDNPQRDIELAALLRSPIYNLSDSDLARIRLAAQPASNCPRASFYQAVIQFAQADPLTSLHHRLRQIIEQLNNFRSLARRVGLPELIWQFYRATGYLSFVSALPSGAQRRANLLKLHDRAIQFESFPAAEKSSVLARFVEFVEKLLEKGADWAPAQSDNSAQNVVRIMSVHKSKGLEFPIVFLAGLETKFNLRDSRNDCLTDAQHALGLKVIDSSARRKYANINHQVIAQSRQRATIAEEMRILYVALTRARERLILVASEKESETQKTLDSFSLTPEGLFPDWQIQQCHCLWQWIIAALSNCPNLLKRFDISLDEPPQGPASLFSITRYLEKGLQTISGQILNIKQHHTSIPQPDNAVTQQAQQLTQQMLDSINYQYPYKAATTLPAKASISALTHPADESASILRTPSFDRLPQAVTTAPTASAIDYRLVGSATHLVIQRLDLTQPINAAAVQHTIDQLCADQAFPRSITSHINQAAIVSFFASSLGQTIIDTADNVLREWSFTLALSPTTLNQIVPNSITAETSPKTSDDSIIVQGIIDLIAPTNQGLIIVDFKTDNIRPNQIPQHAPHHYPQMKLYAHAAQSILQKSVASQYLHFLTPSVTHQIP